MGVAAVTLLTLCACACEHQTTDAAPTAKESARTPPATPTEAPARKAPKCVLTMAADPPPHPAKATNCPADPSGPPALPKGYVGFPDAPAAPRVRIELAEDNGTRERGLMYVRSMPEDQGMLFTWPDSAERSFWMHDTCIPLDMLFVDDQGIVAGILEEVPPMDDTPRGVACPVRSVLELNAGYSRAHGIRPGQRIVVER